MQLKYEPNMRKLNSFWQIAIAEVFRDKKRFEWECWMVSKEEHSKLFIGTKDNVNKI